MSSCYWIAIPSTIRFSDFFLFYVRLWFAFCAAFFIIIVSSLSRSIFLFFFFLNIVDSIFSIFLSSETLFEVSIFSFLLSFFFFGRE